MEIKLFDSELKVMDVLWKQGDAPAREIARVLTDELGWNVNTTYTLIKRCMKKGAIERSEPGFLCHALLPKAAVQEAETDELINKIYDGSIKWIDQQQMTKTQAFFAKHGKLTVVLARFVPIIRSFAPLVAGAAKMNRLNFEASGTVGAVLWAGIILSAGHLFGNIPFIKDNLSLILVGGIVLGLAPFVIGYIVKKWRQHPDPKN